MSNLIQHNASTTNQSDNNHPLNTIKQEQNQIFSREALVYYGSAANLLAAQRAGLTDSEAEDNLMESTVRMYGGEKASNATPVERFGFVSSTNEPYHRDTSGLSGSVQMMKAAEGMLEKIQERGGAAKVVAVTNKPARTSSSVAIMTEEL